MATGCGKNSWCRKFCNWPTLSLLFSKIISITSESNFIQVSKNSVHYIFFVSLKFSVFILKQMLKENWWNANKFIIWRHCHKHKPFNMVIIFLIYIHWKCRAVDKHNYEKVRSKYSCDSVSCIRLVVLKMEDYYK